MNALNIMWLLNDVDRNTPIEVKIVKTKSCDWIEIETDKFVFIIDEYGSCSLRHQGILSQEKEEAYWKMVKGWVKFYMSEEF